MLLWIDKLMGGGGAVITNRKYVKICTVMCTQLNPSCNTTPHSDFADCEPKHLIGSVEYVGLPQDESHGRYYNAYSRTAR
jgi:hypothetical protein